MTIFQGKVSRICRDDSLPSIKHTATLVKLLKSHCKHATSAHKSDRSAGAPTFDKEDQLDMGKRTGKPIKFDGSRVSHIWVRLYREFPVT
jgi:hypothetical protein